jgi:hypothetical protein
MDHELSTGASSEWARTGHGQGLVMGFAGRGLDLAVHVLGIGWYGHGLVIVWAVHKRHWARVGLRWIWTGDWLGRAWAGHVLVSSWHGQGCPMSWAVYWVG